MGPGGNILAAIVLAGLSIFCVFVAIALVGVRQSGMKNLTLAGDTTVGGILLALVFAAFFGYSAVDQLKTRQVTIDQNDAAAVAFASSVRAQGFTLVSTSNDVPPYTTVTVAIESGCQLTINKPEWDGTKATLRVTSPSNASYILTPTLLQQQCHG